MEIIWSIVALATSILAVIGLDWTIKSKSDPMKSTFLLLGSIISGVVLLFLIDNESMVQLISREIQLVFLIVVALDIFYFAIKMFQVPGIA